ncbi:ENDOU [Mytilus edulis]|uniref:ENDOU n=1 Tax=Mytilus edulis TaxID=6550 RepID=A0A8S3QWL5_MYTED|nr:ENDOU [Mytilus edulis]
MIFLVVQSMEGKGDYCGNCSCLNAEELPHNDDDESHKKCLSSCPTCSDDYAFIYKFSVIESCVGKCGQRYDISLPCQCNTACTLPKYNNCCDDYKAFCLIHLESCAGKCEQYNPHLKCQCNTACKGKQDCCDDYDDFCPEEAKNIDSEEEDDDASQFCPRIDSFIEWNPAKSCINFDQLKDNWTGIMRSLEMLKTAPDKWKPLQCKIKDGKTSEDLMLVKSSSNNCSDLMLFYCKNGSEPQKSNTTIMEAQENNVTMSIEFDVNTRSLHNTSNMMTGVIVGTVSLIIAIE